MLKIILHFYLRRFSANLSSYYLLYEVVFGSVEFLELKVAPAEELVDFGFQIRQLESLDLFFGVLQSFYCVDQVLREV